MRRLRANGVWMRAGPAEAGHRLLGVRADQTPTGTGVFATGALSENVVMDVIFQMTELIENERAAPVQRRRDIIDAIVVGAIVRARVEAVLFQFRNVFTRASIPRSFISSGVSRASW